MGSAPITVISLLVFLFLAFLNGVKIRWFRLILILSLTGYMLTAVRFMAPFNLIIPLLLAAPLTRQFPFLRLSRQAESDPGFFHVISKVACRSLHPAYGLIALMVVVVGTLGGSISPSADISPIGAVDYMRDHKVNGKIYNSFNFGGYLVFRKMDTFVDGRTDQLFQDGFFTQLDDVETKQRLLPYLEDYKVSVALVQPDSPASQEFHSSSEWSMVYSDKVSELFQRRP